MFKRLKTLLLPVAILAAVFGGVSANAMTLPENRVGGYHLVDAASRLTETTQTPVSQQASDFSWYDTASECSVAAKSAGGIGPVLQGQAGVARAVGEIEAQGGTILGREITLEAGAVRTRPDLLVRTAEGQNVFVEVKTGGGVLTPNQAAGFPVIETGGAIPRGMNAGRAGLPVGEPLPPTPVQVIRYR